MRIACPTQLRLDCVPIAAVELNHECRDEIIPILAALLAIYKDRELFRDIMDLVARDVNRDTKADRGREGMSYWEIVVLAAVRLGCNFDYDRLQDLAENHRTLRHVMGIGDWDDQRKFSWKRIRDNICLLTPETISAISHRIVAKGHEIDPSAVETVRVDSFVVETNIHYPTESSLLYDGTRKVLELCGRIAVDSGISGWRQWKHWRKQVRKLHQDITRASASKSEKKKKRVDELYVKLMKRVVEVLARADVLVENRDALSPESRLLVDELLVYMERTRQVGDTAYRRIVLKEDVPNADKLFSIFEPHTQLYRRGKAAQENQFGRLVAVYEDGAGFITHHYLMSRDERDADIAVRETRIVQDRLNGGITSISFDRGFDAPSQYDELVSIVPNVCLPKRSPRAFATQLKEGSESFLAARKAHPGVESAIGSLQSGNGLKRSRDRTETGFERYICLGILGRNLHVLGKMLIAQQSPDSQACYSRRKSAA